MVFTYPKYYSPDIGSGLRCKIDSVNPPVKDAYCVVSRDYTLELFPAVDVSVLVGSKVYVEVFNFDAPGKGTSPTGKTYIEFYEDKVNTTATNAVEFNDIEWTTGANHAWSDLVIPVTNILYDPA